MGTLKFDHSPTTFGNPGALYPPALPAPVQARKGGRQIEKTHNTEGLGSENISMFFSNSIVNRKGFLPRPALFRGWTGAGREAGSWMTDTGRTIQGMVNYDHLAPMETSGVFSTAPGDGNGYNMSVTSPNYGPTNFTIDAGLMWGSDHVGSAFAPEHVLLPVILYLGLHT